MIVIVLNGCEEVSDKADQLQEIVEAGAEEAEKVEEKIDDIKEAIDQISKEDGIDQAVLERLILGGGLDGFGSDIAAHEEGSYEDFAKFKVEKMMTDSIISLGTTHIIEYTSFGTYEEVVEHFINGLENSEDYMVEDHYPGNHIVIYGEYDAGEVQVTISETAEGELYVLFTYDSYEDLTAEYGEDYVEDDPENILTPQEVKERQYKAIEALNPDAEITDRQALRKGDESIVIEQLNAFAYPEMMTVDIKGIDTDTEFGTTQIGYLLQVKGSNIYMETWHEGEKKAISIYNSHRNQTCIYTVKYPDYKEISSGNLIPFRLLDEDMIGDFLADDSFVPWYIGDSMNGRYFCLDSASQSIVYDLDHRLIVSYNENWSDTEGDYSVHWGVTNIDLDTIVDSSIFEW